MKKHILLLLLLISVSAIGQIQVTKEGYPKLPNKKPTTIVAANDTIMISKVNGIQMGISFGDFTNGIVIAGADGAQGVQGIQGETGANGADGVNGQGVPTGGAAGQVLSKVDGANYNTEWVNQSGGGGTTQTSTEVPHTPSGGISSTNVGAALGELDAEKANLVGGNNWAGINSFSGGVIANGGIAIGISSTLGTPSGFLGRRWLRDMAADNSMRLQLQTVDGTSATGSYATQFVFDANGVPTVGQSVINQTALNAAIAGVSGIQYHPESPNNTGRIFVGTEAQEAAATFTTNDVKIITDAAPMEMVTSTTSFDLLGFTGMDDQTADTASFTVGTVKHGSVHQIAINRASFDQSNVTGATLLPNTAAYVANKKASVTFTVDADGLAYFSIKMLEE